MTQTAPNLAETNKAHLAQLRAAMYDFSEMGVRSALAAISSSDAMFHACHPFGDLQGADAFYGSVYAPLFAAVPDLERRDYIVVAGPDSERTNWVGCAGFYTGRFLAAWLDIPPTGHLLHMRFHEFYRFDNGQLVEVQCLWDLPEVMMQANAWPLSPSLGREWLVPGPATQDGLAIGPYNAKTSAASCELVLQALNFMKKHPSHGGPEVMDMPRFWHANLNWYGPAGIGSARGIQAFRDWHQIPFIAAMPDRGLHSNEISAHFFADGPYVAVTGWPNMVQTMSHPGWLGIAPTNTKVNLRSLDFWRIEAGKIRENWVLVDLLHLYHQIGVDAFSRIREFNKSRCGFDPDTGQAL
jgi:predicted ester cyclase